MRFTIPASIEDATQDLVSIESLVKASDWKRAAIVAAFVVVSEQGRSKVTSDLSPQEFADLGIAGLRSKTTVQRYVEAWGNRPKPKPGQVVTLPTEDFPTVKTKAQDIAQQPGAVAAALEDPAFAAKVAAKATPKAKSNMRDSAMPPIAPIVDDFGGHTSHDFIEDSVPSDDLSEARKVIARIKTKHEAGEMNWTMLNKGVWDQIVNMVAAVTMTVDLSDVQALAEAEKKGR